MSVSATGAAPVSPAETGFIRVCRPPGVSRVVGVVETRRAQVGFSERECALQRLLLVDELGKRVRATFDLGRGVQQQLPKLGRQRVAGIPHAVSQALGRARPDRDRDARTLPARGGGRDWHRSVLENSHQADADGFGSAAGAPAAGAAVSSR
ncbi:hypothetical protein [Burkholderia ubonensis]|uniref:hypothetical protein n=1 Tax=Burkholderia ubonensis TaxID=101571 RepID=UPI0012F8F957|nr:hypothetical protein [Burkholderia ubonensis]